MKAVKVMVNKGGTGFRPLTKSTPPAVTRPRQMQRPQDKTVEPAPMQVETIAPVISQKKPRVCCYCRVSTLLDSQETSIEGQREHYESLIKGNPEWEFAGIYLEAGVSGTKAEIRPELQRLIADCKAGKIDLILTKSISRFARNTSDCLEMVRLLTSLGVAIHFEKEQIHTDDMHSEFMLSILACLAEDESHSISGNMKWSIRKRFENGTYQQPVAPYGYCWEEGKLVIVPEEAEVVREIFAMSLRGLGCRNIARELNSKKILTARGRKWSQVTIMEMMKNPVYIGDALYQKSYMDETFRQKKNKGELDQFYDRDHHEAIISREDFEKVQAVTFQRAKEVGYNGEEQKRSSNRYCFTGILFCKACGSVMHRQPRGKNSVTWVCHKHAMHPDLCRMKPQGDDDLKRAFINCLNKMAWSQARGEGVLDVYENMLGKTEAEKNAERLVEIEKELEENRNETNKLNAIVMRERFLPEHREKKLFLTKQAQDLMAEKNRILIAGAPSGTLQQLKTFIGGWKITDDPGAFPEDTFTEFVERCIVLPGKMVTKQIPGMTTGTTRTVEKLKVAAYCRVSTDSDEQETSYEAQCRHYTDFINGNPNWELAGIYADEGISGTSTKHREQFNRMIADCEAGKINMVITKSISRWARNTIDSLKNIRKLKDLGIPVLFEKENINTMDAKGEVLITIMSSLAQQESESISKNVRMGIQYIFQQGKGRLNTAQFLGLEKGEDGRTLVIIPEEAALVRRIFREYLEGYSPNMIANGLMQDEILSPAGKPTWYQSTIDSILRNEKYCGDLLLQKYYVVDVLSHKLAKNEGQLPQYFVENAHEPIIPKEVFYQVQGELQRRSMLKNDPGKFRYGAKDALTGRLVCGKCGRKLKRYTNPDPMLTDWRCRKRAYEKKSMTKEVEAKCDCRNANEREVEAAVVMAFNELPGLRDEMLRTQGALRDGDLKRIDTMIEGNQEQQGRLTERLDSLADPNGEEASFLNGELGRLEEERMSLMLERAEAAHREVKIRLLLELIDAMKEKHDEGYGIEHEREEDSGEGACYDYDEFFRRTRMELADGVLDEEGRLSGFYDDLVIRYLDTVTVLDDGYEVNFKAGLTVKVNAG